MPSSVTCPFPSCGNEIPQPSPCCPHCGRPGIFWNVREAEEADEVAGLDHRYQAARKDAVARKADLVLQDFENALSRSKAVITRNHNDVLRLASSTRQLYATYYQLVESGVRLPDGDEWDVVRELADTLLFPHYKQHMRFGALSLDGRGLANYGDCSIILREEMIADRTSVFEENSALFVERHGIKISRHPNVPKGYRAAWTDRAKLGAAKLQSSIDSKTTPDKYSRILLKPGTTSEDDEFIEVHIFGPMTVLTMEQVVVIAPQTSRRATISRAIKSKLAKHKVQVS
ncbi:MAG: hypothetical protein WAQ99_05825 [Pyrinomonadaceae bacterium]